MVCEEAGERALYGVLGLPHVSAARSLRIDVSLHRASFPRQCSLHSPVKNGTADRIRTYAADRNVFLVQLFNHYGFYGHRSSYIRIKLP